MMLPLEKLMENRDPPICIAKDTLFSDALKTMMENDFSQLPVLDGKDHLIDVLSERSLVRNSYHLDSRIPITERRAFHFIEAASTVTLTSNLFQVLDRLERSSAVIVEDRGQAYAILTDYNTTDDIFQGYNGSWVSLH